MKEEFWRATRICAVLGLLVVAPSHAAIMSGTISDWVEGGPVLEIGDGINHVDFWWSINTTDRGFFYGKDRTPTPSHSEVAFATGVTDISQIIDASVFSFSTAFTGPHCDAACDPDGTGDFIVWRNAGSGYYGVLRIDDIDFRTPHTSSVLNGTWWFQPDGGGNFGATSVPEPTSLAMVAMSLLGLGFVKLRKRTVNARRK